MVDHVNAHRIASVLHDLVSWGVTSRRVGQHEVLIQLAATRAIALSRSPLVGKTELADAATQLIVETVAQMEDPHRSAAQELLWITDRGQRPRTGALPSADSRRTRAIQILVDAGLISTGQHVPETWRREGTEVEFFVPLAEQLLQACEGATTKPAGSADILSHVPGDNPNLMYELIMIESTLELVDEHRGRSLTTRTVRSLVDGAQHYEIGSAGGYADLETLALDGAVIDRQVPPDAMKEHRHLLRFPKPLTAGESHRFSVGVEMHDPDDGIGYFFHAAGDRPAYELRTRVKFPESNPPNELSRVITHINSLRRGGANVRPHQIERGEASTVFLDLQPGNVYGFRFHWLGPHEHASNE